MPAIPYTNTAVIDVPWDGPGTVARLSNDAGASTYRKVFAWVEAGADPDAKASYKFPHHQVSSSGVPGAAVVAGARNALSRLPQAKGIPSGDESGIKSHLQKHIDKFSAKKSSSLDLVEASMLLETEGRIWAIRPELLPLLASMHGRSFGDSEIEAMLFAMEEARELRTTPAGNGGNVATIPLKGVLMPQVSLLAMLFGMGSGLNTFRSDLRQAAGNPDVSHIVLDIDSPGGLVDHIPETAAEIRQVASKKPVTAVANTLAASAAYWLGSQASEFVVTPSGETGSIGVYSVHKDMSQFHENAGVKHTIISAGKRKTEGNPYQPLSSDAADGIQEAVNDYYSMFTRDVARGRGASTSDVRDGFGEGRTLTAKRAVSAGLVDRVDTLQGAIARAVKGEAPVKAAFRAEDPEEDPEANEETTEEEEAYSSNERSRVLDTLVALGLNN
jgi:signal peptide peptidase SppA